MSSKPTRKKIIEEILTNEGMETANAEVARVARAKYEVDLESAYVSSVKKQLKNQQNERPATPQTPKKKQPAKKKSATEQPPKKKRAPVSRAVESRREPKVEVKKSEPRTGRVVTLDDVKEVEQALAASGIDLDLALVFVQHLSQPLENVQEVLEWLYQRQS